LGAAGPPHRQGRGRLDGEEEAGRVFLGTMTFAANRTVAAQARRDDEAVIVPDDLAHVGAASLAELAAGEIGAPEDIRAYLAQQEKKSLLRFLTCGSVDDGKSTLIGRLLYDTKLIFDDHLA